MVPLRLLANIDLLSFTRPKRRAQAGYTLSARCRWRRSRHRPRQDSRGRHGAERRRKSKVFERSTGCVPCLHHRDEVLRPGLHGQCRSEVRRVEKHGRLPWRRQRDTLVAFDVTVTTAVPDLPPAVAVSVALPGPTPVAVRTLPTKVPDTMLWTCRSPSPDLTGDHIPVRIKRGRRKRECAARRVRRLKVLP